MILRIYSCCQHDNRLVLGVPQQVPASKQQRESSGYAQLLLIVPLNQIDTDWQQGSSYPKTHGPDHCSFSLVQTVDSCILLGAPRRPCGVQPTVLDALICSFWKRANIIWMTIQLCGVHCHCFIHKAHNQAHWECANKCEGASKCVHDL